ncbi:hypothetical protein M6D93_04485 [Jatrophihabitans telluris]|uniref:DUF3040 domain-containing protein n=1 Tax=Jatrophihabitans telluris TaxID=2038343 RepID=A0ABY4R0I7_9ACTN|nr:hypothetical protein [Jatrophihabitans telluris]UQX89264.1 hypothetical protein M6D93_04485 [Jatrophihabitans telluris]
MNDPLMPLVERGRDSVRLCGDPLAPDDGCNGRIDVMPPKPRYRLTARSVALTRAGWTICVVALLLALAGIALAIGGSRIGGTLMVLAGMTIALTAFLALGKE